MFAISVDFCRACSKLLMILSSPGGTFSFIAPFLIARNIGCPFSTSGGKTRQSIYTGVSILSSPIVVNPSLTPPFSLSTLRGAGRGRLAP